MEKVPLTEEERNSPLLKYFEMDMTPIPAQIEKEIREGGLQPEQVITIQELNRLLEPDYRPEKAGYVRMADGSMTVVNYVDMPGVTAEMFDWWFVWHSLEPMRYKIWDPEDHYDLENCSPEIAKDESLPMRQRLQGTMHKAKEDTSGSDFWGFPKPPVEELLNPVIQFRNPEDLGFDPELLKNFNGTIVCSGGDASPATMCHVFRETEEGGFLITYFWIGYQVRKNGPEILPGDLQKMLPEFIAKGMIAHTAKEFTHLAAILPSVFKEYFN